MTVKVLWKTKKEKDIFDMYNNEKFDIESFIELNKKKDLLKFSTAGSVDDGKSTLIGRLLHDSKNLFEDTLEKIKDKSAATSEAIDLALVTDGLKSEQEQKITIDVAYRYFSTPSRNFILADTPGHEQYTRNMATGASNANAAIILIDASKGVITQTRRHSFILSLLGIKHLCIAINKMDMVDYDKKVFDKIKIDYLNFSSKLNISDLRFIPISALKGDNVVNPSKNMNWFHGETILEYLENLYIDGDRNFIDLRLPIQNAIRPSQNYRGYCGSIVSGVLREGDEVVALPSMQEAKIKAINTLNGNVKHSISPQAVTFELDREIDLSRGDMIVHKQNIPQNHNKVESMLVWMSEKKLNPKTFYLLKHCSTYVKAKINPKYSINVNTLHKSDVDSLELNEIGRCQITTSQNLFFDSYRKNRLTGSFIIIDPISYNTVAAGMIIDRLSLIDHQNQNLLSDDEISEVRNIYKEQSQFTKSDKESLFGYKAQTYWLTGLSGSGKSTLSKAFEKELFCKNRPIALLDGDNIRFGLNKDLGFSIKDRKENIRRIAEVAKLFNKAGISVITAFIAPFSVDRENAKKIIGEDNYKEIYISTSLEICEKRDPKQLYKKARSGEIPNFTGITSPYEIPKSPWLELNLGDISIEKALELIVKKLENEV
jgi:bifunctional enzyme CysN/CysC